MSDLTHLLWPVEGIGQAIEALAHYYGLPVDQRREAHLSYDATQTELDRQIRLVAHQCGLEAQTIIIHHAVLDTLLYSDQPVLFRLVDSTRTNFLVVVKNARQKVLVLGPDLMIHRVLVEYIEQAIGESIEGPFLAETDALLRAAGVSEQQRRRARSLLLRERLTNAEIGRCWQLSVTAGTRFAQDMRREGVPRLFTALIIVRFVLYSIFVISWAIIGRGIYTGHIEFGWLAAWALALLSIVPLKIIEKGWQGLFSATIGALLKRRLFYGVLKMDPDSTRHQGIGQILGRVHESATIETLALDGAFLALIGIVELVIAACVLASGTAGLWHVCLLVIWLCALSMLLIQYYRRHSRWTEARRDMTHDMIEHLVGYRTRLAQEVPARWHDEEDRQLEQYFGLSRERDRIGVYLTGLIARGWLFIGLLGLIPAFVNSTASSTLLTVSLGGILLADQALRNIVPGLVNLTMVRIAWGQIDPLFQAASRETGTATAGPLQMARSPQYGDVLLDAQSLVYHYPSTGQAVIDGCNLQISSGDRLLLEGPSGSGKSTLVSLLSGVRVPDAGFLLLGGLDRQTHGTEQWRHRIACAPQFHENHVIADTFAFNLLMGRRWPPSPDDVKLAEEICLELGLADLISRMPSGMLQFVGDTGWQLSHGERGRLYVARALLQDPELVILDESLAALDPENLQKVMDCVLARAKTLLLIAHP